jgi:putative membrane protein
MAAASEAASAEAVEAVEDSVAAEEVSAAAELPEIGDMPFLTADDIRRIERAVEAAEERTAAEFVTVIAHSSGSYLYLPTLAAAAATLLLSGVALVLPSPFTFTIGQFYLSQVIGFVALWGLFQWSPVRRRIVPRDVQRDRARLRAHELFLDLGLVATRDRTGVLFFVSVAERYVEIIADRGVSSVVDNAVWNNTLADFTAAVRQGRIADGFLETIEACTRVLAERLPRSPGDINELPNRLVEL